MNTTWWLKRYEKMYNIISSVIDEINSKKEIGSTNKYGQFLEISCIYYECTRFHKILHFKLCHNVTTNHSDCTIQRELERMDISGFTLKSNDIFRHTSSNSNSIHCGWIACSRLFSLSLARKIFPDIPSEKKTFIFQQQQKTLLQSIQIHIRCVMHFFRIILYAILL